MHMADARAGVPRHLGGIGAPKEKVAGIEAKGYVRRLQEYGHLLFIGDSGPEVRMKGKPDAVRRRELFCGSQARGQSDPALLGQPSAAIVAGTGQRCRQDELIRA